MTGEQRTTLDDVAQALGLRGEKRKSMQGHPLPTNTAHDPEHHLFCTITFGQAPVAVTIVTGIPEGANELARSTGSGMDWFFAQANEDTGVAQVYVGSRPADILRVFRRLPPWFRYALQQAAGAKEIHIAVFSAGVFALSAFRDLSTEPFERISARLQSLTLASPFLGTDCVASPALRSVVRLLGFPSTAQTLDAIAPLIENLQAQGRPVRAILGQEDPVIDGKRARDALQHRFLDTSIVVKPRQHAPSPEELWPY